MTTEKNLIIAIDGYSSTGKSTLARDIARRLKIKYIDSGAMYRAVTLYALRNQILNKEEHRFDEARLKRELPAISIDFHVDNHTGTQSILMNAEDVSEQIRTMEVSKWVSQLSQIRFVREKLVDMQRSFKEEGGLVMEGRDIGTVVFPDADVKIFLTASATVRAQRRFDELKAKGYAIDFEEVLENVRQRDHMDENREESPLRKASDAVVLDNGNLSREEQLEEALRIIRNRKQRS